MVAVKDKYTLFLDDVPHHAYLPFVRALHDGHPIPNLDTQVPHSTSPLAGELSLSRTEPSHRPVEGDRAPVGSVDVFDGRVAARGQRTQLVVLLPPLPRGNEGSIGICQSLHTLFEVLLLLGPFVDVLAQGFSAGDLLLGLRRPLEKLLHGGRGGRPAGRGSGRFSPGAEAN